MFTLRRTALAATMFFSAALGCAATGAVAAPATVSVRVEGAQSTIFDHVVTTDGHAIRATSDAVSRTCDGTNNGANPTPGPTATTATVDGLSTIGKTFDGKWTTGTDDYYLRQWADERESDSRGFYWGVLVNGVFTPTGGCQVRVAAGDEVLWVMDAFSSRPLLWLAGPAEAVVGTPLSVQVTSTDGKAQTAKQPYAGATVDAVDALGRPAPAGTATPGASAGNGAASVTFTQTGWQRLKARHQVGAAHPLAVASNSIDVCVKATVGAAPCQGPAPSQVPGLVVVQPKVDPPTVSPTVPPVTQAPAQGAAPQLTAPQFTAGGAAKGLVGVSWAVTAPGVGVRDWTLASRPAADSAAPFVTRATGTATTAAQLRLPAGVRSLVRLSVVDTLGRAATADVGSMLVPIDDRSARVKKSRRGWSVLADAGAWNAGLARGRRGATLSIKLSAGRPVVFVRGVTRSARLELRSGKRREVYRITGSKTRATRQVQLSKAVARGTLRVRVLSGTVGIDGVAVD
ncbi:MAG: hypothetical protein JHD16_09505 [Solirubrobacteraceae bacterium]|nr:hypothetical protein [Solirubrobacteraceae bacterium]